tara:strand:- start:741 stop:2315 length:1575 start_codon:yes stop_codon:yes gene_type:complete
MVVDDMGYSDLGAFGSEIPTPNLDQLAYNGVRLSNFITHAACSPTRAALLTGVDPHRAGLGNMLEELSPNQKGQPGYEGYLKQNVVTIATLLRDSGYKTYMTGKWHLGVNLDTSPYARGFERSFTALENASHFADMLPAYSPDPNAKAKYLSDDRLLDSLPESFDYSSQFFVDQMIEYIGSGDPTTDPFFAYVAFTAPHWPLQAPNETLEKFKGAYSAGYDVIFDQRFEAQKALGLIPEHALPADRSPKGQPWVELTIDERAAEQRRMEVYAAMISEIDTHSGRLIGYLENAGLLEDTVIFFISDNGAEGHDIDETWPSDYFPAIRSTIDDKHDHSVKNMGRENSYTFYGPNWARVSAPAFRLFKAFPSEGGIHTAGFAYFPNLFLTQTIVKDLILAKDIAATILDLANVEHPGTTYRGKTIEAISGISALPYLTGLENNEGNTRIVADELFGKISVRRYPWKLIKIPPPHGTGDWELFNLDLDLAEQNNLAETHHDIVDGLVSEWKQYELDNGVILPDWVSGY